MVCQLLLGTGMSQGGVLWFVTFKRGVVFVFWPAPCDLLPASALNAFVL